MMNYSISSGSSTAFQYSFTADGLSCIPIGGYSKIISEYTQKQFNGGYLPFIQTSFTKKIKVRYNNNKKTDYDIWRLIIDGKEQIVSKIHFLVRTETTIDWDEESKSNKAHISCNANEIIFETINNNIIATIK